MSFEEEVVVVHRSCKHCSKWTSRLVCFDRCCKNNHISLDMNLFVQNQIASLNIKSSVALRSNFSYLTFDVVNAILFNSAAIELIKEFTWSTNVNVEYIAVCIRIVVACKDCVLCSIHTTDLRAVLVTLCRICRTA